MTTCKYCPHPGQPHRADHERNWAVWRDYRTTSAILREVGRAHGIGSERVRQIVIKADRAIINALTRTPDAPVPTSEADREGTLGVEFVFTHEAVLDTSHRAAGWEPLADVTGRGFYGQPTYAHRYAIDEGVLYHVKKND
jgi:hypothetical protein